MCFTKFPQFSSKLSEFFFLVKDLTNLLFSQDQIFEDHTCLGCDVWKMDDLFQQPYFYHPKLLKKRLVKADIKQLSPKKIEEFWWKLKEYKPYPYSVGHFGLPPPPASFRVKWRTVNSILYSLPINYLKYLDFSNLLPGLKHEWHSSLQPNYNWVTRSLAWRKIQWINGFLLYVFISLLCC